MTKVSRRVFHVCVLQENHRRLTHVFQNGWSDFWGGYKTITCKRVLWAKKKKKNEGDGETAVCCIPVLRLLFLRSMDSEKQNQGKTCFGPEAFDVDKNHAENHVVMEKEYTMRQGMCTSGRESRSSKKRLFFSLGLSLSGGDKVSTWNWKNVFFQKSWNWNGMIPCVGSATLCGSTTLSHTYMMAASSR